jgi:hypothetical protein
MRSEIGEPTGMRVRRAMGAEMTMEFSAFVAAIERGDIGPEDEVCSHIVTQGQWVWVGEMRLYWEIRQGVERAASKGMWPPAPVEQ